MTRRPRAPEEPENHERWLVSYADFITLMFAFFVVMFASSQADQAKAKRVSNAVEEALATDAVGDRIRQIFRGKKLSSRNPDTVARSAAKTAELTSPLQELTRILQDEIRKGNIQVSMEARGLVISLKQGAFFPTGDATIAPSGYAAIEKVSRTLLKVPNPVRLEGHTDSVPIRNGRFSNNWELSSARSIAMLELLTQRFGIPASRLAVTGYAETSPVDTNETEEGRARNRRVDITVLNELSVTKEPQAFAGSHARP